MTEQKKVGLVQVLELIRSGFSPSKISKVYKIPKQNVSYFVVKLQKLRCIQKKGYGVWEYLKPIEEVKDLTTGQYNRKGYKTLTSPRKEIRGHAFIWKIEFVQPYDWKRIVRSYKKKRLTFQLICNNKILRTIFNDRKIWLNLKGLTIYEPIDFMGSSSFQVKGKAVYEMDRLIKDLLKHLGLKFRKYRFTTSREHYGIMKHELARQYNEKKEKMKIRSEDGDVWMWIDDSKGLNELENNEPSVNRQVQNFWNSHRKHNFKYDADFVAKGFDQTNKAIKKNAEHLGKYAKHLKSHVASIQQLRSGVENQNQIQLKTLAILERIETKLK